MREPHRRCRICACPIRGEKADLDGKCFRCRERSRKPKPICPYCGRGSTPLRLKNAGMCLKCGDRRASAPMELVGREREHAIAQFMEWFATTKSPWERARSGLRMFVPDDGSLYWP